MKAGGISDDQRGVSEIYGTLLIVTFAFATALLLFVSGWVVVDLIQTESTDSLSQDSMRNVDQVIENLATGSVNESGSFEFPTGSGDDVAAAEDDGTFTLNITTDNLFWNRTAAYDNGSPVVGSEATTMGAIRHESADGSVTAYQGGGLWQKPDPAGDTFILSEPRIDFTENNLDIGMVSLSGVESISEGGEVTVSRNAAGNAAEQLRQFVAEYWTDRYNPSVTAPVHVNITIESEFADGWATYFGERLTKDLNASQVLYPFNGNENKVKIIIGKIGSGPAESLNPTFGDQDVLYAGTSDLAYLYYNDSAGEIEGNATRFDVTEPSNDANWELALYNESGQWLIFNDSENDPSTSPHWEDRHGNTIDPANTEAINASRSPPGNSNGVAGGQEFYIDPPTWLDESAAAPVCVVTGSGPGTNVDILNYIDEAGEDCLSNMVGIDDSLVGPVREEPDFDVDIGSHTFDSTNLPEDRLVSQTVPIEVNVTNRGVVPGSMPLGVYAMNVSNWEAWNSGGSPTGEYLVGGTADLSLNASESTGGVDYSFDAAHSMAGDDWVVFATTGNNIDVVGPSDDPENVTITEPVSNFAVEDLSVETPNVTEGNPVRVEFTVNETLEQLTVNETQRLRMTANGIIVDQREVTLGSGEDKQVEMVWNTRDGDAGEVTLNISTYDDHDNASVNVLDAAVPSAQFLVQGVTAESPVLAGDTLDVNATIANVGNASGDVFVKLRDTNDSLVDVQEVQSVNVSETRDLTLTWDTTIADAGSSGDITVETTYDSGTAPVEVQNSSIFESDFEVTIHGTNSPVTEAENLTVDATIENTGNGADTQSVTLENFHGGPVDVKELTLSSGDSETVTFTWETIVGDAGNGTVSVVSADDSDDIDAEVQPKEDAVREPVDVVFSLDETGSIGNPDWQLDYGEEIEDPSNGSTHTVPTGEVWKTQECVDMKGWGCADYDDLDAYIGGTTFTVTDDVDRIESTSDGMYPSAGDSMTVPDDEIWRTQTFDGSEFDDIRERFPGETFNVDSNVNRIIVGTEGLSGNDPLGQRIAATKNAIGALNASKGDMAGAVRYSTQFSGDADTYIQLTSNFDSVNETLERTASGTTNIAAGISEAAQEVSTGPNDNKFVILLTDGQHNVDGAYPRDAADDVSEDITLYTVGFGDYDEDLLRYVATEGGSGEGQFYAGDNADQLPEIFEQIIGEVTEPETPTFNVSIENTNEPVNAGEILNVEVDVTNTGPVGGEKIVTLADHQDTNVDSEILNLSSGESATQTLQWDTIGVSPGERTITVKTVDDNATETVTIDAADPSSPEFDVEIQDTNDPVPAGTTLEATVNITNTGSAQDVQQIELRDFNDTIVDLASSVDLDPGDEVQRTLTWIPQVSDVGNGTITVKSETDQDTEQVEVQPPSQASADLEVQSIDSDDSVTAGETVEVTAEIENVGDAPAQSQYVSLVVRNGANTIAQRFQTTNVSNDSTTDVTFHWDTSPQIAGNFTLIVETDSDSRQDTVDVQARLNAFDITIESTNAPITAGEDLDVQVRVTNNGPRDANATLLLKDAAADITTDMMFDVEVPAGDPNWVGRELTWNTRIGDGNDNSDTLIRAAIANTNITDHEPVEIEAVTRNIDDPSMAQPGNPLDIDLSEIDMGSD